MLLLQLPRLRLEWYSTGASRVAAKYQQGTTPVAGTPVTLTSGYRLLLVLHV